MKLSSKYNKAVEDLSLMETLRTFRDERDWGQFHTPENLAKSISIEAAELLECFQWGGSIDRAEVQAELADVLTYCLYLADELGLDPVVIVREKLEVTRVKYPLGSELER